MSKFSLQTSAQINKSSPSAAAVTRLISPQTVMLAGLCAMYMITYIDRVNISTAAPVLRKDLALSETELGLVFSAFAVPYGFLQPLGGWLGGPKPRTRAKRTDRLPLPASLRARNELQIAEAIELRPHRWQRRPLASFA